MLRLKQNTVRIRESVKSDKDTIRIVHQNAFGELEGDTVSQLAIALLECKTAQPVLSLVAEQNNQLIGNAIFSPVSIEGFKEVSAYILAPLAVLKDYQGKGVGTKLINKGLEILKDRGAEIVLVYGDPKYYVHTGFRAGHNLRPPHKLTYPKEAWMAQELKEGVLAKTQGTVQCALPLNSPEHW